MKVKVYSIPGLTKDKPPNINITEVNASYEGNDVLPVARSLAIGMSMLTPIILETDDGIKEVYEKGKLVETNENQNGK